MTVRCQANQIIELAYPEVGIGNKVSRLVQSNHFQRVNVSGSIGNGPIM